MREAFKQVDVNILSYEKESRVAGRYLRRKCCFVVYILLQGNMQGADLDNLSLDDLCQVIGLQRHRDAKLLIRLMIARQHAFNDVMPRDDLGKTWVDVSS
jgi:hypothetical protein